jgi:hypothetical protein
MVPPMKYEITLGEQESALVHTPLGDFTVTAGDGVVSVSPSANLLERTRDGVTTFRPLPPRRTLPDAADMASYRRTLEEQAKKILHTVMALAPDLDSDSVEALATTLMYAPIERVVAASSADELLALSREYERW